MTRIEAMDMVTAERQRQISVEGWTPEHDDHHDMGELLRAGMLYLHHGTELAAPMDGDKPLSWPWDAAWWKPKDRRSNLIRAGALMLAEQDRLLRISRGAPTGHITHKLELVLDALAGMEA